MNKTAILNYILDEVIFKCRNVSSNMRKRIHWMLEEKDITVKEYDKRALAFNGWIRIGKEGFEVSEVKEIEKGVSNYCLETKEQFDRVMSLNNEVRCHSIGFKSKESLEIESIEKQIINGMNYRFYSRFSFNKVKHLIMQRLSTDKIKDILTRFKRIYRLEVQFNCIESIDFSKSGIKEFYFQIIPFMGPVYLPREVNKLKLNICENINHIKAQKVNQVHFKGYCEDPKEHKELAKTFRGVKDVEVDKTLGGCLAYFPSSVRKIKFKGDLNKIDNLEGISKLFPYLIEIESIVPIEIVDNTKLRVIEPELNDTEKKFKLRPRKIKVTYRNACQLANHPELFEKVENAVLRTNIFNFDVLPREIKRIDIVEYMYEKNEFVISLKRNASRFEKTIFYVLDWDYQRMLLVLECLEKGTRVVIKSDHKHMVKHLPDLEIAFK